MTLISEIIRAGRVARLLYAILFASGLALTGDASDSGGDAARHNVDRWREKEGLPHASVLAIVQTRDGYIWLGTWGGLVRFDGVRFTAFNDRTGSLKDNQVSAIEDVDDGSLWVATAGGLTRYKEGVFTTYTTRDGLPSDFITRLEQDRDGSLWIGTQHGLSRFRDGNFTTYTMRDGLDQNLISALYADANGTLWVGTGGGLSVFEGGSFSRHALGPPAGSHVSQICGDHGGAVWVSTTNFGVTKIADGVATKYDEKNGLPDLRVRALHVDRKGRLWVGVGGGLLKLEGDEFSRPFASETSGFGAVEAITSDAEGSLWIGTMVDGLARLKEGRFANYAVGDGLPHDVVRSVYEARDGSVWLGTQRGASQYKGGHFTNHMLGLSNKTVTTFAEDRDGTLWVGTRRGAHKFRDGKFTPLVADASAQFDVRVIYVDREGQIWIGTNGRGVALVRGTELIFYTTEQGLANNRVRAFHHDRRGALWVGTRGGGVSRFEGGRFTNYGTGDGLSEWPKFLSGTAL